MTAQQLLLRSLDWKLVMTKAGVRFSKQTIRAVNSLVEYLCAAAEIEAEQAADCDGVHEAAALAGAMRMANDAQT